MESHPLADIFPLHDGENISGLRADLKSVGQQEPIWTFENKILDGRRRELACTLEGIEPWYKPYKGNDPLSFVISKNLHRRHLSDDERAFVAAKIANMGEGRPSGKTDTASGEAVSQTAVAELLNVSRTAVQKATAVHKNGTPALQKAVQEGSVSLSDAAKVAGEPAKVQNAAVKAVSQGKAGTATEAAKPVLYCRPCRVGTPVKGCKACAAVRKPKAIVSQNGKSDADETREEVVDAEGTPVPELALEAFAKAKELTTICRDIDAMIGRVDEISKGPGGRLIRMDSFRQQMKDAKGNLWANRATHVCGYCKGTGKGKPHTQPGRNAAAGKCEGCNGEGWTAKHVYQQTPGVKVK